MCVDCTNQITSRRSIRKFARDSIPESVIETIVKIGISAPSAGNLQPWRVVIVKNQDTKNQLSDAAGGQIFLLKAPVVFIVCGVPEESAKRYKERGRTLYVLQDTAALTLNILHAAHMLGYGACWVGAFNEEEVSKILQIPSNMRPIAMIPVGKIEGEAPNQRSRKNLSEVLVRERF